MVESNVNNFVQLCSFADVKFLTKYGYFFAIVIILKEKGISTKKKKKEK